MNAIIALLHNVRDNRWHPIIYLENSLPGPPSPDKPVRHKSKGHHTTGFPTRDEAVANARGDLAVKVRENFNYGIPPGFALAADIPWDGVDVPASAAFFVKDGDEYKLAL